MNDQASHTVPGRTVRSLVSIIIPALNEERHIQSCLASVAALEVPSHALEVLLVDNGSTDRTLELAKGFSESLNLTILQKSGVRISALRNQGALHSSGQIFAFLDADCLVSPHWLGDLIALQEKLSEIGVLGAPYNIPAQSSWVARVWEQAHTKSDLSHVRYIPGGGMLMRRAVFDAVGGFDESIETNEDSELCARIRAFGLPIVADRTVAVLHLGTSQTLHDFYRRQHWHGTHVFKVFLRSPGRSGNERAVLLALYTLIFELGIGVGLVAGRWSLALLSLVLWLAPAFALALQRSLNGSSRKTFPHLVLLYLTYGVARAHCLVLAGTRK
ncbi:MAG: glycosyltransferase [Acidobacteria bacterium]|nr:glycosyltransferase [Acidobacteriota bacterium]